MSLGREALFVAGLAAVTVGAGCSGSNGEAGSAATITESTTTTLLLEGDVSQYDLAEDAVWEAYKYQDFEAADQLIVKVTNPTVRALAEHAIDAAEAEEAAWLEYNRDDHEGAERLLSRIQNPELAEKAEDAITLDQLKDDLWDQSPRDTTAWYSAKTASQSAWYDLKTQAQREWYDIYQHGTEVKQDNATSSTEANIDSQPLLDAEAALMPIEAEKFTAFVTYIKHNGKVLEWSEGSRYQVVAFGSNGVVFTAELDFGQNPPRTPEELTAAAPEFIQVYARFPGEKHATHAFIDGNVGIETFDGFVPDGRANQLFGFGSDFPAEGFDYSDKQAYMNGIATELEQSGQEAQELYEAAVEAVLNS